MNSLSTEYSGVMSHSTRVDVMVAIPVLGKHADTMAEDTTVLFHHANNKAGNKSHI